VARGDVRWLGETFDVNRPAGVDTQTVLDGEDEKAFLAFQEAHDCTPEEVLPLALSMAQPWRNVEHTTYPEWPEDGQLCLVEIPHKDGARYRRLQWDQRRGCFLDYYQQVAEGYREIPLSGASRWVPIKDSDERPLPTAFRGEVETELLACEGIAGDSGIEPDDEIALRILAAWAEGGDKSVGVVVEAFNEIREALRAGTG
jgi:hypothetical protein